MIALAKFLARTLQAEEPTGRPLVACLRGADILMDAHIDYGRRHDPYHDRAIRRLLAAAVSWA